MKITQTPLIAICCLLLLAGCQYFQFPGVHKINIQQGHIITKKMIDQLEPGMSKRQVRYILGTPLVSDLFNDNQWDYYYSLLLGDGRFYKRRLTVFFDGNSYTHYTGENLPKETKGKKSKNSDSKKTGEPATPVPNNDASAHTPPVPDNH